MTHDNARSMYLQILIFEARILVGNKCNLITVVLMVMLYASDFLAHPVLHMKLEAYFFFFFRSLFHVFIDKRGGKRGHSISDFIQRHKRQQRAPTSDRHGP